MYNVENFVRLTRINEYFKVLLLLFPLIFMISPQNFFSYMTIEIFLSNLLLTAFTYTFNDVEDAEDDYFDANKRKRNPVTRQELTKKQGYIFSFILLATGLFLLYLISSLTFVVGVIFSFIGFIYSWKPIRLKSIPIIDLVSHVLFLGILQFLTTYLTYRTIGLRIIPFLLIIIPFSLINQLMGELNDLKVDKETNNINTIQKFKRIDMRKIVIIFGIVTFIGFSTILFTDLLENRIVNLPITLLIGSMSFNKLRLFLNDIKRFDT
jgi:4-hydroxybenzoate polyprenyltransferase